MINGPKILTGLAAVSLLALGACASSAETQAQSAAAPVEAPKPVAPASIQTAANAEAPTPIEVGEDGSRIICKRVKVAGTKFHQKTCATALVWEERTKESRKAARENTKEFQRKGRGWEPPGK